MMTLNTATTSTFKDQRDTDIGTTPPMISSTTMVTSDDETTNTTSDSGQETTEAPDMETTTESEEIDESSGEDVHNDETETTTETPSATTETMKSPIEVLLKVNVPGQWHIAHNKTESWDEKYDGHNKITTYRNASHHMEQKVEPVLNNNITMRF